MKKLATIALCVVCGLATAEEVNRNVAANADGLVTISNTAGQVDVRGWTREQVEVQGDLGRGVQELIVERDGNEVRVIVKVMRRHSNAASSDLQVHVPENSSLKVAGVSADISVETVHGAQRLQTVSGDIETQAFDADIDAQTVSGDLAIAGDGRAMRTSVTTVSGDAELENLRGDLEASTVSGDLLVAGSTLEHASLDTTSGDIAYYAAVASPGRLDVSTINGDVDIELTGPISARFDIETFSGDIRNCFGPKPSRTGEHTPGRALTFTEGDGAARVTIRTLNGDLRLCKD